MFEKIYEKMQRERAASTALSRFGGANADGTVRWYCDYICYAEMRRKISDKDAYIFSLWNGEESRKFSPGPVSDRWLDFLLDPERSPWRAMLPFLVSTDKAVIRESGFIIKDLDKLSWNLLFNFLIATRYAYEFKDKWEFSIELMDTYGVEPAAAFLIGQNFRKGNAVAQQRPVIQPAGFRRDPADRRKNLRDADGNPIWFPAEYGELPEAPKEDVINLSLRSTNHHEPLPAMNGYVRRVLSGELNPEMTKGLSYKPTYGDAWNIFKTDKDVDLRAFEKLAGGCTLDTALDYINKYR